MTGQVKRDYANFRLGMEGSIQSLEIMGKSISKAAIEHLDRNLTAARQAQHDLLNTSVQAQNQNRGPSFGRR